MRLRTLFHNRLKGLGTVVAIFLALSLGIGGCDTSVSVLNPSDQYRFSMFGVLRVSADTQVVRIEPLGDTTQVGAPSEIKATVLLENRDDGTQVALNDSLTVLGGGVAQVHNFWTTYPIDAATSYKISVRVNGEPVTTATTTTPAQPPILEHKPDSTSDRAFVLPCEFDFQGLPIEPQNTFDIRASGVESIAAAEVRYPIEVRGPQPFPWVDHYNDVVYREEPDHFRISVFYAQDLLSLDFIVDVPGADECPAQSDFMSPHATLRVAAGGPNWPDWRGVSLDEIARPDTFTNVEGGHGFVGGIYSDTLHIPVRRRE